MQIKKKKMVFFAMEATDLLYAAADQIDALRGEKALLEIQLEYAKKHIGDKDGKCIHW
mgnify:CR=1 FL=1